MWKKIKAFFNKKNLNELGWKLYHELRRKSYSDKFKNQEDIKRIPCCSIGSMFGGNQLTKDFQELKTGEKKTPTHTILYLGGGDHTIAEADVYFSKNKLERYARSKVVFHYFKNMTVEEVEEIKRRIYYLLDKKLSYDFMGYIGFVSREISFLRKVKLLMASDTTVFCSDGVAVVYHGDENNNDENIKKWGTIRFISGIYEANKNFPAAIYLYLHRLHEAMPDKVGEIILYPFE